MLPFARLLAASSLDASPPGTWYCTSGGGASYLYGYRSWYGRDDDGNGYSYLYLPIASAKAGTYRLSFRTDGQGVSHPGGTARPGLTQYDFRLGAGQSVNMFIRTDAQVDTYVTNITLEQIG